ncbi:MAG: carboxypeptidase regulatory-like domain-containing protein [Thaumarchaeota archaeon]|nr:carboxypeptidase regulatory-like domain-containing protein [Nitrososphaerota archaeon]
MSRLPVFLLTALMLLSALPLPSMAATQTVAITVTANSLPVSGASVALTINGTTLGFPSSTTTGSNGIASFLFQGHGVYSFAASKFGYVNQTKAWHLTATNYTSTLSVSLTVNSVSVNIAASGPSPASAYVDGVSTALPAAETWVIGTSHNITAPLNLPNGQGNSSRWSFSAWSNSAPRKDVFSVSGALTLTATYGLQYALTTSFNKTRGTLSQTTGYFPSGQSVSILATPANNYLFVGYLLDGVFSSKVNPLPLLMNQPHTLAANFTLATAPVTFSVSGLPTLSATVDGKAATFPANYAWLPGQSHKVVIPLHVSTGTGARATLTGITQNGTPLTIGNFTAAAGTSPTSYVLTYSQEYLLTTSVNDQRVTVS